MRRRLRDADGRRNAECREPDHSTGGGAVLGDPRLNCKAGAAPVPSSLSPLLQLAAHRGRMRTRLSAHGHQIERPRAPAHRAGVTLRGQSSGVLEHNVVRDGRSSGVYVLESATARLTDNTVFGNNLCGIEIDGPLASVDMHQNIVRDNGDSGGAGEQGQLAKPAGGGAQSAHPSQPST